MEEINKEIEFERWLQKTAEELRVLGRVEEAIVYLEILIKFRELYKLSRVCS